MDNEEFNLSEIQKAYYLGRNEGFELGGKSTQVTYTFETELDVERLEKALNREIKRQPMLRAIVNSENKQTVLKNTEYYKFKRVNISDLHPSQLSAQIEKEKNLSFSIKFIPDKWPLFEWKYVTTGSKKNYLIVSFDLLISDGASLMTLANEVIMIYDGREDELPELKKTYRDYIEEKQARRSQKKYISDKKYWMDKIDEIPSAPKLAYRKLRSPNIKGDRIKRSVAYLKPEQWKKFNGRCISENVSPTIAIMTSYLKVLGYWAENKEFTVNMTLTERKKNKMENVIGDYTSSLLIPVDEYISSSKNFWDSAKKLNTVFFQCYRHSSFEGVELIKEISKQTGMITMATMPIVFTSLLFKNGLYDKIYQLGKLTDAISKTPQVIIDCQIEENNGSLVMTWDYVDEYIDEFTISKMQEQMRDILNQSIAASESEGFSFSLTEAENAFWDHYNQTDDHCIMENSLIEMFEESVKKYPNRIAVSNEFISYTYRQINDISDRKALYIWRNGIKSGHYVAVIAHPEPETIINIISVLKVGAAYVPIGAAVGEERRKFIISNAQCKMVLDGTDHLSMEESLYYDFSINYREYRKLPAYVIYTSGTTGTPKGVIIKNEAVSNTIQDVNQRLNVTQNDKFIGLSSMTFDLSVYDIFGALSTGAELVMVKDNGDPRYIRSILMEKKITIWNSVPSIMEMLLSFMKHDEVFDSIKHILLSGDWIPIYLPNSIYKAFPNSELYSLGGATESSIWSIIYPIKNENYQWKSIPYGYPMKNQKIYVVDRDVKLCPMLVPGEICIGGKGLADEYQNDKKRTSEAFITTEKLGRIYKTGDVGIMDPDGYIRILGRIDFQLKINGFRIESEEIISLAMKYSKNIRNAVVVPNINHSSICCFVETDAEIEISIFIDYLSRYLPPYMVPSAIYFMKNFPLTSNGKVSRSKLIKLTEQDADEKITEPVTDTEKILYDLWCTILGRNKIGTEKSFFELGGDSIKAARILGELEQKGYQFEMATLFRNNTIKKLARVLEEETHIKIKEEVAAGEI